VSQTAIFGPFLALMLLTLLVWAYMYVSRIHFLQSNAITPDRISTPAFRALHSAVHCTFNHIMTRFSVDLLASLALWFMLARAALAHFSD
jgi:hypothetical protein